MCGLVRVAAGVIMEFMKPDALVWSEGSELAEGFAAINLPARAAASEAMDARVFLRGDGGEVRAWASLWWRETPLMDGSQVGAIGGFGATDPSSAMTLLQACHARLHDEGRSVAVGPMNGNTWRSYRFVVESNGRGAFLMEPGNPPEYPEWWRRAGFSEIGGYSSSAVPLDGQATVPARLVSRLAADGLMIRELRMADYESELAVIHKLTLAGFSANFLYTPLGAPGFREAYLRIRDRVDPRFVLIAERNGRPCGYVFAIADLEASARGEKPALVVKTLTVDPAAKCPGLGSVLVDEVQRRAHAAGFVEALHVLQYDDNTVLRITRRHGGERFRRYALFSRST